MPGNKSSETAAAARQKMEVQLCSKYSPSPQRQEMLHQTLRAQWNSLIDRIFFYTILVVRDT